MIAKFVKKRIVWLGDRLAGDRPVTWQIASRARQRRRIDGRVIPHPKV
jgi:hypothetical protein